MAKLLSAHLGAKKDTTNALFLDFEVGIGDHEMFIDPYSVTIGKSAWHQNAHNKIIAFFDMLLQLLIQGKREQAIEILSQFHERNQTRLGYAKGKIPHGKGLGYEQAKSIISALEKSRAFRDRQIQAIEDWELFVSGIAFDKVSDIVTNIILADLCKFTEEQASIYGIKLSPGEIVNVWDTNSMSFITLRIRLPNLFGQSFIMVPKDIARQRFLVNSRDYYNMHMIPELQNEYFNDPRSSLIRTLKNGERRPPHKKIVKELYPFSKDAISAHLDTHPNSLQDYKTSKINARDTKPSKKRKGSK